MNCADARQWLSPHLDAELEPRVRLDLAEHLEGCPDCTLRFERERRLECRIAAALSAAGGSASRGEATDEAGSGETPADDTRSGDAPDPELWSRIEDAVRRAGLGPESSPAPGSASKEAPSEAPEEAPGGAARAGAGREACGARHRRVAWRRAGAWGAVVAACLVVAGVVWLSRRAGPGSDGALGRLGALASRSHRHYVEGRERPAPDTRSPEALAAFFRDRLGLRIRAPQASRFVLVGGRVCSFDDTPVACVMGRLGHVPVSIFVFPALALAKFGAARASLAKEGGCAGEAVDGQQVYLTADGQRAVCLVAAPEAGPLESLAGLMAGGS